MRELTEHVAVKGEQGLRIVVMDEPGPGGAHHHYRVGGFTEVPPTRALIPAVDDVADVIFQNGPIPEAGVNGLTQEALLAIVADRLRSFQEGPFPCEENRVALMYVEGALSYLKSRTRKRVARCVEGRMES